MIRVNGKRIEFSSFPDGTSSFRFDSLSARFSKEVSHFSYIIEWKYDDDKECILLWYLTKHIREHDDEAIIGLLLPYIPNARMDRVKHDDEVFTLKWFAEFINSLAFDKVYVQDPHSNVSTALLDRVSVIDIKKQVAEAVELIKGEEQMDVLFCYPDEGAAKRYSEQLDGDYVFGIKERDWRSGAIKSVVLTKPERVKGRDVLIVDDICSRGGTFIGMAKALKDAGAGDISLYVTHCENTIYSGSVLTDGLISRVFTTDSIYRGDHPMVTVL